MDSFTSAMKLGSTATTSRLDLDSHADSPVVGRNSVILSTQNVTVKVNGITKSLGSKTVPVVDAAVAYAYEFTGKVYLLIIRNALYFEEMDINLIAPLIMRLAGLIMNEEPRFMVTNPTLHHHSIEVPTRELVLPLSITEIISYLPTRKLTPLEINMDNTQRIKITPPFSN